MYLTEALRVNGKATRTSVRFYATLEDCKIVFKDKKTNTIDGVYPQGITISDLNDDWQPYEPEKEKCEACKEADEFANTNTATVSMMVGHLRKYHCQCKGDK